MHALQIDTTFAVFTLAAGAIAIVALRTMEIVARRLVRERTRRALDEILQAPEPS